MGTSQILIISRQRLFVDSLTRLIQAAGDFVIVRAESITAALPFLIDQSIQVIIVDQSEAILPEDEIVAQVMAHSSRYRVIFLRPVDDQMIIYYREERRYSHPQHLVEYLNPAQ